jgi:hypothetical protein
MKRILKIIAISITVLFLLLQPYRPDQTNPPTVEAEVLTVPQDVSAVLKRSCYDCHSNETTYPWYSQISPASWFLDGHIRDGREELNFSVWNTYSPKKQARRLEEVCDEIRSGQMPLPSYLWIHGDAALKGEEADLLCNWAAAERAKLPAE